MTDKQLPVGSRERVAQAEAEISARVDRDLNEIEERAAQALHDVCLKGDHGPNCGRCNTVVQAFIAFLDRRSDRDREGILSGLDNRYCLGCGAKEPATGRRCQCRNDE